MIRYRVVIPPSEEPVTVDEMRRFIGIGQAGDISRDADIDIRIKVARLWCESYCSAYFIRQTVEAYLDDFGACCECVSPPVNLRGPVSSVISFHYLDADGADTLLDPSGYVADLNGSRIVPAYNTLWPSVRRIPNAIRIRYEAGEANAAAVDERIKEAIRFIVLQWERFQNVWVTDAVYPPDFPNVAKALLADFVDYRAWHA